jgi:uncharacterized protein (DUF885 family)
MKRFRGVMLTLALAGCSGRPAETPAPTPPANPDATPAAPDDANGQLDQLAREHLNAALAFSPATATWLGSHAFDDRLDDLSADAQAREAARLRTLMARVRALPEAELDAAHRLDRTLLEREAAMALLDLEGHTIERNPLKFVDIASASIAELLAGDFAPLPDRVRAIDRRLARFRGLFDEARRTLKNPPELATRRAIELAQGTRGFLADTLPKAVSALGDDKLLADFRAPHADALRALDDFIAWMQKDLLPRSRGELPLGRDRLLERLRVTEAIDLPLDQLQAAAERDLKASRQRTDELARAVAPGKTAQEAARLLEDDHPSEKELIPQVTGWTGDLAAFVRDHKILTVPPGGPRVAEMPPFLWGFTAASIRGPLEQRSRDAWLYVDPVDRSWNKRRREEHLRALNRPQLLVTAIHEAWPGHWVQAEAARRAPTTVQKLAQSYAFTEGWAGYAEQLVLDEKFAAGDLKLRLAQAREALVRAGRFVAVLRFHAGGAKLEDLVKLFGDDCLLDDHAARREAERVALDPAGMLPALGRLAIVKLRDDYREARGDAFSLTEFHDKLLARGALPLPLVRKLMLPGDTGNLL